MERRSSLAMFAARAVALALAVGIATWLVIGAQRRANLPAADPATPTAPVALDGALHGSKSLVLETTNLPTFAESDEPLFSSKSGVVRLPDAGPTPTADIAAPVQPQADTYLPSSKVLRLAVPPAAPVESKPKQ